MAWLRLTKETAISGRNYRLVVRVDDAVDIDRNVFLYLALPLRESDVEQKAIFQGVCSARDMTDWPIGEPAPSAEPPWLRHHEVDLLFPSQYELNAAWTLLREELDDLCRTFSELVYIGNSEQLEFGTLPEESESASESV